MNIFIVRLLSDVPISVVASPQWGHSALLGTNWRVCTGEAVQIRFLGPFIVSREMIFRNDFYIYIWSFECCSEHRLFVIECRCSDGLLTSWNFISWKHRTLRIHWIGHISRIFWRQITVDVKHLADSVYKDFSFGALKMPSSGATWMCFAATILSVHLWAQIIHTKFQLYNITELVANCLYSVILDSENELINRIHMMCFNYFKYLKRWIISNLWGNDWYRLDSSLKWGIFLIFRY